MPLTLSAQIAVSECVSAVRGSPSGALPPTPPLTPLGWAQKAQLGRPFPITEDPLPMKAPSPLHNSLNQSPPYAPTQH